MHEEGVCTCLAVPHSQSVQLHGSGVATLLRLSVIVQTAVKTCLLSPLSKPFLLLTFVNSVRIFLLAASCGLFFFNISFGPCRRNKRVSSLDHEAAY